MKIVNLRHFVIHEGSYRFLHLNSISRKSVRAFWWSGGDGAQYLLLFPFVKTVSRAFSLITSRMALPRRSEIQEKRKRN